MQTRPCSLITAPAEHTLQCYRAHPVLLAGQPPHRAKPHSQWRSRILKHRACGRRNLIAAAGALNTARLQRPALAYITSRTMKPVRPAEIEQVLPASLLGAEAPLELLKRPWIILFHDPEHYRLGLPESNGYPVLPNSPERAISHVPIALAIERLRIEKPRCRLPIEKALYRDSGHEPDTAVQIDLPNSVGSWIPGVCKNVDATVVSEQ